MRSYGALSLSVTSPVQSFVEPLELADVVKFLELPEPVASGDEALVAMLDGFIAGAREQAEYLQGRDLVVKSYDLALDYFPRCPGWNADSIRERSYEIELREPLVGVDLVRYRDSDGTYTTMVEDTGYIVDLARGLILPPYGESWPSFTPWPSSAVLVRFRSGLESTDAFWNDAGPRLKIGMKHLISAWHNNRLPFELGANAVQEYPYTVTHLLSAGGKKRVR